MAKQSTFVSYLLNRVGIRTMLVIAVVIFGFLVVDDMVVRHDLTQDARFSISEASHDLASALEDPLTIRAYFSNNLPERLVPLQRQVFDILSEYEAQSGGTIKVERFDPLESRTAADEAKSYGIRPVPLVVFGGTDRSTLTVYGGIVLLYRDQKSEVINIAQRYPQGYQGLSVLEYEISSKIWQLTNDKPQIGICGHLAAEPPPMMRMRGGGQPRPEFQGLRRFLGEEFDVIDVDLKQSEPDPKKTPLLLVVRPKEFTDVETFRLDQYLMKGGRVLMFLTQGMIEGSRPPPGSRYRNLFRYTPFKTGLEKWLDHHGVSVPNEFVVHRRNAIPTQKIEVREIPGLGRADVMEDVPNWFWPVFASQLKAIDKDNPATQTLDVVMLFWPHPVEILNDKLGAKTATVLLRSHEQESWRWKDLTRVDRRYLTRSDTPDPSAFQSTPVAVAIEGTFESYFAKASVPPSLGGNKTDSEGGEPPDDEKDEKKDAAADGPEVVKRNAEPTQLVVIGNAMVVSDSVLGGQQANEQSKAAALLAFNLVDWLARSKALIALRAKQYAKRTLVDPDFEDDSKALKEKAQNQEISEEEYREQMDELGEKQKLAAKRWRWINVLVPCLLVLAVGAIVWIIRAAWRTKPVELPAAEAPDSTLG